jgi:hypothetical protein
MSGQSLLLVGIICLSELSELPLDLASFIAMLAFEVLDESLYEVIEVVIEAAHLVLHVFLEADSADLCFVYQAQENGRAISL